MRFNAGIRVLGNRESTPRSIQYKGKRYQLRGTYSTWDDAYIKSSQLRKDDNEPPIIRKYEKAAQIGSRTPFWAVYTRK